MFICLSIIVLCRLCHKQTSNFPWSSNLISAWASKWSTFNPVGWLYTRVGNIWFFSPLFLSKWEDLAFSVCMLFLESVFIFQFLNNEMQNYVLFNTFVHFFIQKLKNKHTFLKTEKTKFSRRENLVFYTFWGNCVFFNFLMIKFTIMFCFP